MLFKNREGLSHKRAAWQSDSRDRKKNLVDVSSVTEEVLLIPAFPLSFSLGLIVFIYNSYSNHYPNSAFSARFLQLWSAVILALQMTPQQVLWLVGISSSQSNQKLGEVSRSGSNLLMRRAHWHTCATLEEGATHTHTHAWDASSASDTFTRSRLPTLDGCQVSITKKQNLPKDTK